MRTILTALVLLFSPAAFATEFLTTISGHRFYRDYSVPEFGEAWRDEEGLIWGGIMKGGTRGWTIRTLHFYAKDICKNVISSNGSRARLPTVAEYRSLMEKMKKKKGRVCKNLRSERYYEAQWARQDYCPQIIPNLDSNAWTSDLSENQFGYRRGYRALFVGAVVANPTDYEPELFFAFGARDNRVAEEPFRCVLKSGL